MTRVMDIFALIISGIITFFSFVLGGFDGILITLLWFSVIDYFTGVLSALYNKKLDSDVGFKGIIRKLAIYIVVSIAVFLNKYIGIPAIREIVIMFYIANEGISILENVAEITDGQLPVKLTDVLKDLRNNNNKSDE